jgi:hypothetical protein
MRMYQGKSKVGKGRIMAQELYPFVVGMVLIALCLYI